MLLQVSLLTDLLTRAFLMEKFFQKKYIVQLKHYAEYLTEDSSYQSSSPGKESK